MHYLKNTLILSVVLLLSFSSCKKDDDNTPTTQSTVQQGKWRISLFVEAGVSKIDFFNGYEFSFSDNGVVTVNKTGAAQVTGSWNISTSEKQEMFLFNFGSTQQFGELNDTWRVVERTNTRLRLEHTSGTNGGTDLLTLEKQ